MSKDEITEVKDQERFIVIDKSASGHCCFEFTVIDTNDGKDKYGYWHKPICECFSKEDADNIASAMNKHY